MYLNSSQPWLTTTCTLYTGESCSLLRAQTDSIDLYQVHWPDRYVPMFGETDYDPASQYYFIQFLGRVVDAGKIRFIGVSNETPYGVMKFLQAAEKNPAYPRIISVQNSYNLLCRNFDSGLAECCHLERYVCIL
ncbi:putative D-xylose reductase [Helianthus annuus]|uniref:D-xylose reductase n=1 Tax=Helianthus annuus TaxID=4232 RepID=A0A9K3N3V0_HELAN|nr:putative D-xylose reductase [Helianthus annuus]KAJ0513538.1 putative D-xylose reductase [Helianthus annuus]KAJ0529639.1 putative D-xylose reductase [Helianthus annuus]KAJ0742793.1 putative D-xylose reductase [Helianthus annuus]